MKNGLNMFSHRMNLLYVLSNVNIQDSHGADIGVPIMYETLYLLVFILISIAELYVGRYKGYTNTGQYKESYEHIMLKNRSLLDIHSATIATPSFSYHVIISLIKALFADRKSAPLSINKFLLLFK